MELLTKLGIDWKLLVAQIVNFAILLVVLRAFVYKPVLEMLERRSKTIEKGLKDAKESEEKLSNAEKFQDEKIRAAEREVGKILESARQDSEKMSKQIVADAHAQAEEILKRTRLELEEEKVAMMEALRRHVTDLIIAATSKILKREFSDSDQKRLSDALLKEMKTATH